MIGRMHVIDHPSITAEEKMAMNRAGHRWLTAAEYATIVNLGQCSAITTTGSQCRNSVVNTQHYVDDFEPVTWTRELRHIARAAVRLVGDESLEEILSERCRVHRS